MNNVDSWEFAKQRMLARWPALTAEDIEPTEGRRDKLVAVLETRLGYARSNAEHDVDQILEGDVVVPRDVADEYHHTNPDTAPAAAATSSHQSPYSTSSPHQTSSPQYVNGGPGGATDFASPGGYQDSDRWRDTSKSSMASEMSEMEMAWPWRATAYCAAAIGAGGVMFAMLARRRSQQRKHLVIPLPTQAESAQAVETVGRFAGSGWRYLRSATVLLIGGIAGWGVRRYQAM